MVGDAVSRSFPCWHWSGTCSRSSLGYGLRTRISWSKPAQPALTHLHPPNVRSTDVFTDRKLVPLPLFKELPFFNRLILIGFCNPCMRNPLTWDAICSTWEMLQRFDLINNTVTIVHPNKCVNALSKTTRETAQSEVLARQAQKLCQSWSLDAIRECGQMATRRSFPVANASYPPSTNVEPFKNYVNLPQSKKCNLRNKDRRTLIPIPDCMTSWAEGDRPAGEQCWKIG